MNGSTLKSLLEGTAGFHGPTEPAVSALLSGAGWAGGVWYAGSLALLCALGALGWSVERKRRIEGEAKAESLARERDGFRAVVAESPDCLLLLEVGTGRIVMASHAVSSLLGYQAAELTGMEFPMLFGEEAREMMQARLANLAERGAGDAGEILPRHRSGVAVPVELRARTVQSGDRQLMQLVLRDLRPEQEERERLLTRERRYEALFHNVPVAVVEKDYSAVEAWLARLRERGVQDILGHLRMRPAELVTLYTCVTVVSANQAALRNLGLGEAATGGPIVSPDLIPTHLLQLFQREIEVLWEGRRTMTCLLDFPRADGVLANVLMHWSAQPRGGPGGGSSGLLVFTDVTEQRLAEQRTRLGAERPGLALEAFEAGVWECDFSTGESHFSERWKSMLGYQLHEIGDRREEWLTRVHPEDRDLVESAIEAHLRGETERYETEHRVLCKDGKHRWVLSRGRLVGGVEDGRSRIVGAHADIHERKQVEETLRRREERLRLLFEMSAEGICESAPDGRLLSVNSTFATMLGYESTEQLLADPEAESRGFYVEAERRRQFFEQVEQAGELRDFEAEIRTRSGGRRWVSENVRVLRDREGLLVGIHSFITDVTARRRAAEALVQSEQRLRHIIQHADCMLWQARVEERAGVLCWHCHVPASGLQRRLRLQEGPFECGGLWTAPLVAESAALEQRVRAFLTSGASEYSHVFEVRAGETGLWLSESVEIRSVRPGEWSLVGVVVDVTKQRQAEGSLAMEQQRSSRLESLSLLAGGIAHDFNNLLTVVMGNLTLAMMDTHAMSSAGRWLKESEKGVIRARDLTQQLLSFARGGTPVKSAVSLSEVVRETTEFALHGSKVKAHFDFEPRLLPVEADKGQIGQVVQNIVINAVQAMPQGGEVRLSLRNQPVMPAQVPGLKGGAYVQLTIEDTGQGIRPENMERIFEPYFTTKPQGSGLGLATVYSIIRKHQGHVTVESKLGKGTLFRIWLPTATASESVEKVDTTRPRGRGGRVLFMDDEEPLRRLGQALLQSLGHDVRVAGGGAEAVVEYEQALKLGRPFDVVILDLTVPGGLGAVATLERLKALNASVKAVVMSGYSSDPALKDPAGHGFAGVLMKPYRVNELARLLVQAMS